MTIDIYVDRNGEVHQAPAGREILKLSYSPAAAGIKLLEGWLLRSDRLDGEYDDVCYFRVTAAGFVPAWLRNRQWLRPLHIANQKMQLNAA